MRRPTAFVCSYTVLYCNLSCSCSKASPGVHEGIAAHDPVWERIRPIIAHRDTAKNRNFAPEDRRDFSNIPKCAQLPHICMTYEVTHTLICLFSAQIAKKLFLKAYPHGKNRNFASEGCRDFSDIPKCVQSSHFMDL